MAKSKTRAEPENEAGKINMAVCIIVWFLVQFQKQHALVDWAVAFNIRTPPPVEDPWNSSGVKCFEFGILQG